MKKSIIEICRLLAAKDFVASTDGNVSVRYSKGIIITTPSGLPKSSVTESDLVLIDIEGKILEGKRKPSSEIKMHLAIYKKRPDINAVIHAHPVYATGFAASRMAIDKCVLPEVIAGLGSVPVCTYATPSTEEVVNSINEYISSTDLLLLQNHGAVTYGKDIYDAYYKMEKLEHTAKTLFVAKLLGGENVLLKSDVDKLKQVASKVYKIESTHKINCIPADSNQEDNYNNIIKKVIQELNRS